MSSDLASCKKERAVIRRLFTKTANELESKLNAEYYIDSPTNYTLYTKLKEFNNSLLELNKNIKDIILIQFEEEELEKEIESQYEYKDRWTMIEAMYNEKKPSSVKTNQNEKRNFKLPQLEMIQFDGHLKNWLPFWGQFSKIHEDAGIDDTDKYMYLLQSMKNGSEVRELVQGFPAISYKSCIDELKSRFARDDLLIQIYIREILSLVLIDNKQKDVSKLYDKLSAHLRALETLNVTKDKYAAFLLPMVESSLPHDLLKIWERSRRPGETVCLELNSLLTFLRKEIESEQRLEISKNTFNEQEIPLTAECLISNVKTKNNNCIWCDKDTHASVECYKINRLTVEQRKTLLKEKKACLICLRRGHHSKVCRAFIKCLICTKRHSIVMCPDQKLEELKKKNPDAATALSSMQAKEKTLLQTVIVEVQYKEKKQQVRALFDSGSQRTYIKKNIVEQLNIPPIGKEELTHVLFGGLETKSREFKIYNITVSALDNTFDLEVQAISQNKICGNIPTRCPRDTQLNKMLATNNINLTDESSYKDIGLLIGADYLGLLLSGTMIQLKNGLVAVKTKVGWTLQGKYRITKINQNNLSIIKQPHSCGRREKSITVAPKYSKDTLNKLAIFSKTKTWRNKFRSSCGETVK